MCIRDRLVMCGRRNGMEQLPVLCSYHVVRETRNRSAVNTIKQKMFDEFLLYGEAEQIFKDVRRISVEARVDAFPKRILDFSRGQILSLLQ